MQGLPALLGFGPEEAGPPFEFTLRFRRRQVHVREFKDVQLDERREDLAGSILRHVKDRVKRRYL
ncbi:MAG: hypothetical protein QM784_08040 [Polyangiaceae bacterium]